MDLLSERFNNLGRVVTLAKNAIDATSAGLTDLLDFLQKNPDISAPTVYGKDGKLFSQVPVTEFYNFGQLNTADDRPILVGIGGDYGESIIEILSKHPELDPQKFILQYLERALPQKVETEPQAKSVVIMEHCFIKNQPIKGAKCYYLRHIVQEFPDPLSLMALRCITPALASDSVVLFTALVSPDDVAKPPAGWKDYIRTTKTESDIRKLAQAAGLEIANFHRAGYGSVALIEARLTEASADQEGQENSTGELPVQETTTIMLTLVD